MRFKTLTLLAVSFVLLVGGFILFHAIAQPRVVPGLPSGTLQPTHDLSKSYVPVVPALPTLFTLDTDWLATLAAERVRTIIVTGDIIPARSVNARVFYKQDPLWPYEKVGPVLSTISRDALVANLESPLLKNCPVTEEGMVFCGSEKNVTGLSFLGVNIANIANNHFGNYATAGIAETTALLKANNIAIIGDGNILYKNIRGKRFAFLAYNDIGAKEPGISWADESSITSQIAEARKQAEIVLVFLHAGVEYRAQPDDRQIALAHVAIDNGADAVFGNHPHWIQPVEFYKNKMIMYAHGNFIFDQMWSQKTREGVIGVYRFYDNTLIAASFLPLKINDFGQAVFLEGAEKERILTDLQTESIILQQNQKLTK